MIKFTVASHSHGNHKQTDKKQVFFYVEVVSFVDIKFQHVLFSVAYINKQLESFCNKDSIKICYSILVFLSLYSGNCIWEVNLT